MIQIGLAVRTRLFPVFLFYPTLVLAAFWLVINGVFGWQVGFHPYAWVSVYGAGEAAHNGQLRLADSIMHTGLSEYSSESAKDPVYAILSDFAAEMAVDSGQYQDAVAHLQESSFLHSRFGNFRRASEERYQLVQMYRDMGYSLLAERCAKDNALTLDMWAPVTAYDRGDYGKTVQLLESRHSCSSAPTIFEDDAGILAISYAREGRVKKAEAFYKRAAKEIENYSADETFGFTCIGNTANLAVLLGNYSDADKYFERMQSSGIMKNKGKQLSLWAMYWKAELLMRERRLSESEALIKETIRLQRIAFGNDSAMLARSVDLLGHLYEGQGRLDKAMLCYREALQARTNSLGVDAPLRGESLADIKRISQPVLISTGSGR